MVRLARGRSRAWMSSSRNGSRRRSPSDGRFRSQKAGWYLRERLRHRTHRHAALLHQRNPALLRKRRAVSETVLTVQNELDIVRDVSQPLDAAGFGYMLTG